MRCDRIPDDDSLFRHSVYPVSFSSKKFAQQRLIKIYVELDGSLLVSLTWERYIPTAGHIHSYGCRLAARRNDKSRAEGKFSPRSRQVYCGAYQLLARTLRSLPSIEGLEEIQSADVIHNVEEDGEIAHVNLKIVLNDSGNSNIEGTKTAIVDRIWNRCSGPLKHICDCDFDLGTHPNTNLVTAPGGPYFDYRSGFERLWHVVRFRICEWLWRTLRRDPSIA